MSKSKLFYPLLYTILGKLQYIFFIINDLFPYDRISFLFQHPKEIIVFNVFIIHDPNPNAIIINEILHHSLVINVLLTSTLLLIPRPYLDLSSTIKGNFLNTIFRNHKEFLLIISKILIYI